MRLFQTGKVNTIQPHTLLHYRTLLIAYGLQHILFKFYVFLALEIRDPFLKHMNIFQVLRFAVVYILFPHFCSQYPGGRGLVIFQGSVLGFHVLSSVKSSFESYQEVCVKFSRGTV